MEAKPDGGSAFPQHGWSSDPRVLEQMKNQGGMTLRDYFAAQAMMGEIASASTKASCEATAEAAMKAGRSVEAHIAFISYRVADAMLAERAKQ